MIIKQLVVGPLDVFCYIVGCEKSRQAMVIDPGGGVEKIVREAEKADLEIRYIVNTHNHSDHTAGNRQLKEMTGAPVAMHTLDATRDADILLDTEKSLQVGELQFTTIHTPGHTPGSICLYGGGQLFTGDTLFVKDSGRTDLPGGHRPTLGASLRRLMAELPEETVVWPGHDYGPMQQSTLGWEKRNNINAKEYGF